MTDNSNSETIVNRVEVTPCKQCGAYLEPGSAQCAFNFQPGVTPVRQLSWVFRDGPKSIVVASTVSEPCFEAARDPRGRVRWQKDEAAETITVEIEEQAQTPLVAAAVAAPAPIQKVAGRSIRLRGRDYPVAPEDALALVGALALAVDGETASVTLASGDTLELTHSEVSDLGRQLAGKPADEVPG